ncbi:LAQU0S17e01156g1_1 [Lachancea quebecensis]|uniref:LAQU0S17e01156g1_1 n=1 Tax=Lachancea quebecensis TaxID=1654605 RepID=A0A0P1KX22_9SACH|nr:LAQU0S17e01156g1_1 [Lachancea quebecensis]
MESQAFSASFGDELSRCATMIERYIVSLVNVAYYACFHKQNEDAPATTAAAKSTAFKETRDRLLALAVRAEKLTSSEKIGPADMKGLVCRDFLQELHCCSQVANNELLQVLNHENTEPISGYEGPPPLSKIPTHLRNCTLGFVQIFHFFRKLPVQEQYHISALQARVLERELKTDLLGPWTRQVETLHSTIGWILLSDSHFQQKLNEYKSKTQAEPGALAFNEWLRYEIRQ